MIYKGETPISLATDDTAEEVAAQQAAQQNAMNDPISPISGESFECLMLHLIFLVLLD